MRKNFHGSFAWATLGASLLAALRLSVAQSYIADGRRGGVEQIGLVVHEGEDLGFDGK